VTAKKVQKIAFVTWVALGVLQVPWFIGAQILASKTQVKTTATVVRIASTGPNCISRACDRSSRLYPVYEYFDEQGVRHEQDDRYFGEFKQNNPLRGILGKEVGDVVTAYYAPGKPEEVLFMASPLAYTAWIIPSYFALGALLIWGGAIALRKVNAAYYPLPLNNSRHSHKTHNRL
jgi:hypothetical protein